MSTKPTSSSPPPLVCFTASAFLIHHQHVLLVKHKKLQIWLAPGGHLEPNELPHQTAEREFLEETGIPIQAVSPYPSLMTTYSQFLPLPWEINLHWISRATYRRRLQSPYPNQPHISQLWPKGCEQHLVFIYLAKPVKHLKLKPNRVETDGEAWFSLDSIPRLHTTADVKKEIRQAFYISKHL